MSDENLETLATDELRASLRHLAARQGLDCEERSVPEGGLHVAFVPVAGEGETYFADSPAGTGWLSLSLVLVVDGELIRENLRRIVDVASRFETAVALSDDASLTNGEAYLSLSLRVFRDGWNDRVFAAALRTLAAAKDGLAEEFA